MGPDRRAVTLIETAVALGVVGLLGLLATGVSANLAEESRTAKCQSNLKQMITAIHAYTADYDGVLPGPIHPAIRRGMHDQTQAANPSADRKKTLAWLLRPYFPPAGPADSDPALVDPVVDEILRCPTAERISPDERFYEVARLQTGCWRERPYSYAVNTWGPFASPGTVIPTSSQEWSATDPPNYFGVWFLCDSSPQLQTGASWCPVRLDEVPNADAEWATADAWYRRVGTGTSRPGPTALRPWMGTINGGNKPLIPAAPYHRTNPTEARSHYDENVTTLPRIPFTGETNMAYFDGHVAPFSGTWSRNGDGGTVNPYWQYYGGTHGWEPWIPRTCPPAQPPRVVP